MFKIIPSYYSGLTNFVLCAFHSRKTVLISPIPKKPDGSRPYDFCQDKAKLCRGSGNRQVITVEIVRDFPGIAGTYEGLLFLYNL